MDGTGLLGGGEVGAGVGDETIDEGGDLGGVVGEDPSEVAGEGDGTSVGVRHPGEGGRQVPAEGLALHRGDEGAEVLVAGAAEGRHRPEVVDDQGGGDPGPGRHLPGAGGRHPVVGDAGDGGVADPGRGRRQVVGWIRSHAGVLGVERPFKGGYTAGGGRRDQPRLAQVARIVDATLIASATSTALKVRDPYSERSRFRRSRSKRPSAFSPVSTERCVANWARAR